MFTLREEHLAALQPQIMESFEALAVEDIRETLPRETAEYSDDQIKERIRSCRPMAARYRLVENTHLLYFVMATFLLGEFFWLEAEHEWARTLLESEDLEPEEKSLHVFAFAKMRSHTAATSGE